MIISDNHIKAFEQSAIDNYVVELAEHCRNFSPRLSKTLSSEQLNAAVRQGVERAEKHEFTFRGPIRFYVDLMIVFGSGFDTDPQYPWIGEILAKKNDISQMVRSETIHDKTLEYLARVDGENNVYTLRALEDLSILCRKGIHFKAETFEQDMLALMKQMHPRKVAETGDLALRQLIADGKARGQKRYGFRETRSYALITVLMFAFGYHFDADPFLPWISRTLSQIDKIDPDAAAKDLERRALVWVDAVLRNAKEDNTSGLS